MEWDQKDRTEKGIWKGTHGGLILFGYLNWIPFIEAPTTHCLRMRIEMKECPRWFSCSLKGEGRKQWSNKKKCNKCKMKGRRES